MTTTQECCEQYWTSPGGSPPQNSSCTATYHPLRKLSKFWWTRHVGHCWRSRDELISDILQWTPSHGRAKAGQPAWTYIQQLCDDTGCSPEDLPEAMNDREGWGERVRYIRADSTTWWWWWLVEGSDIMTLDLKLLKIVFELSHGTMILGINVHFKFF